MANGQVLRLTDSDLRKPEQIHHFENETAKRRVK